MFCFPLLRSFSQHLCPLHWPGDIIIYREALATFTQQGLIDSQQTLSLLNTEISHMRKAILHNRMALDIIIASQRNTCVITQSVVCSYLMNLPMYHLC